MNDHDKARARLKTIETDPYQVQELKDLLGPLLDEHEDTECYDFETGEGMFFGESYCPPSDPCKHCISKTAIKVFADG